VVREDSVLVETRVRRDVDERLRDSLSDFEHRNHLVGRRLRTKARC
jgi:hypothetical protein